MALHGVLHDQIDAAAEDLLEAVLDAEEVEQADGAVEVDQEAHIAVLPGLPRATEPNKSSERTPRPTSSARDLAMRWMASSRVTSEF